MLFALDLKHLKSAADMDYDAYNAEFNLPPNTKISTKWLHHYVQDWKGRTNLLHEKDIREAGYDENFLRRLSPTFLRLPSGKRLSPNVVDKRAVYDLRIQIERAKKLQKRRKAKSEQK
jgi:hypothetical protein